MTHLHHPHPPPFDAQKASEALAKAWAEHLEAIRKAKRPQVFRGSTIVVPHPVTG